MVRLLRTKDTRYNHAHIPLLPAPCPVDGEIGEAYQLVDFIEQRFSLIRFAVDVNFFKRPVVVERNGSMVKQVIVTHQIHAAVGKEATHVFPHFLAVHE